MTIIVKSRTNVLNLDHAYHQYMMNCFQESIYIV